MSPLSLLLNHPLSRDAVALGRFVVNPEYPDEEYAQPQSVPETGQQPLSNLHYMAGTHQSASFRQKILELLSLSASISTDTSTHLASHHFVSYQLRRSDTYFRNACGEMEVRRWLEERARRRFGRVFFICGFKTMHDASTRQLRDRDTAFGVEVAVPASMVVGAVTGAPLPIPNQMDVDVVGFGGERRNATHESIDFDAPGEQVFAIQYRRVNFSWFSADKIEKAQLEAGNRWRLYGVTRGNEDEDVIQAVLTDADKELEMVDGGYESIDLDGETFIYSVSDEPEEASEEEFQED